MAESFAGQLLNHEAGEVFVVDFEGRDPDDLGGPEEKVGAWLADQFSGAVSKSGYKLKVIDRRQYTFTLGNLHENFENDYDPPDALSVGRSIGADTVVEGTYLYIGNKIYLNVAAYRASQMHECLSVEVGVLELTPDGYDRLRTFLIPRITFPLAESAEPNDLRSLASKNFTSAKCVYCPKPTFAIEAHPNAPSGGVILMALITTDGRPTRIRVMRSLSPERDEQAVRTVQEWRFNPASKTPGGKPVPCDTPIWVAFQP
ncbi:MAG: energy transducer TonB [Candidatus Acidiferrales bacterium]